MDDKKNIEWTALEYGDHDRGPDWFWGLGVLVFLGAVASFFYGNALFAVLILIGGFTVSLYAVKKPRIVTCKITPKGIVLGTETHPYRSVRSFWIREEKNEKKLLLLSEKIFMPHIVIGIPKDEEEPIREYLSLYLPEEEHAEPLSHVLMKYLKF